MNQQKHSDLNFNKVLKFFSGIIKYFFYLVKRLYGSLKDLFLLLKRIQDNYDEKQAQNSKDYKERLLKERIEEAERERTRAYFDFRHVRGTVYGVSKERYRDGEFSYIRTEFFLDIPNHKEIAVALERCNLPFSNGQKIVLIDARPHGESQGYYVRSINFDANSYSDIDWGQEIVCKKARLERGMGLKRLRSELISYSSSIKPN